MTLAAALSAALVATPAAAGFGAIAMSAATGGYGVGEGVARAAAEQAALGDCASYGGGCAVGVAFEDACGALARGGPAQAAAQAGTLTQAEARALDACGRLNAAGCEIEVSFCARH